MGILMEQVRGLQFRRLELWSKVEGATPVWFSIDGPRGEQTPGESVFASSIGTNLKKLNEAEMSVLTRHEGALLDACLQEYSPELIA